ncbi:T9SS type A sorting domain-containing protein [Altibacter sp. HG106]|uniref:T9SS type A sorting domain-containing protein n=1 Tax=Altibacter sp. HG106 TaxID=3023937 RepID=UPI00235081F1|nr:T9SS type A sorting domain-containing protein [Altibacter sp. HG106]MDC7995933.1 T9SS type A sorting domain-containing protein [Altibacter sp. HG106]
MKLQYLTLLLLSIFSLGCQDIQTSKTSGATSEKAPTDVMFMQRAFPSGQLNTSAYREAIAWKKQRNSEAPSAAVWEFTGPTNIGGRITDIEIPSNNPDTYYVGAASGGIFKTTDGGSSWTPIFDDQEMLSIGDITISEANNDIVWVGTGEVNAGGGSLAYDGDGVYQSIDGGLTWQPKGLPDIGSVGKILIDPNDGNTVFVGAMGPLFRDDDNRGVYRTTDGGTTWEQVLFISDVTGVIDMAMHPTHGDILYAATWERIRRPEFRQYGGATSGIYRSLNGGDSWTELTTGLPSAPTDKGRISIVIAPSNPDVLYARYANASGSIEGVYRSSDGGDSWTEVNSSQLTNVGFHWWFRGIYVDPTDEDVLYNVDFVVEKSTDGGNNWTASFPGVHVDQHAMAFHPNNSDIVLLGNDGGFYKSLNGGASWTKDETLPITQFYRFHVDAQNSDKRYGGAQDNSTMRTSSGALGDWNIITGGDGFQPLVDPTDTNVIYALSQYGGLVKSTNNGASFNLVLNGIDGADRNNWDTPICFDPDNSQTLYFGTNRLYRTTNAANNWTVISPDLTNGPGGGNLTFGTLTTIDVSTLDSNRIYTGADDGTVFTTPDGGTTWTDISAGLPDRWVTKVLADRVDANTVYVTLSGYRFGEDNGHVYKSTDAGATWTNIGTSLPDIPVNDIVKDRFDNLIIATDVGVFGSQDEGTNWQVLGANIPSVVVNDMHIDEANDQLYIATYGRSSYRLDLSSDIFSVSEVGTASPVLAPNPASERTVIFFETPRSGVWKLYNATGTLIEQQAFPQQKSVALSVATLSEGMYYVQIVSSEGTTTQKLLVSH